MGTSPTSRLRGDGRFLDGVLVESIAPFPPSRRFPYPKSLPIVVPNETVQLPDPDPFGPARLMGIRGDSSGNLIGAGCGDAHRSR